MKKHIIILGILLLLSSCGLQKTTTSGKEEANTTKVKQEEKLISVTSSIVPISSIVNTVGGDFVDVYTIIPAGVSPHGFDLSAKDAVAIEKNEIAFVIGLDQIDGFLEKVLKDKRHIELAEGIELLEAQGHDHSAHSDERNDEHHDDHDEEGHDDDHDDHENEHNDEHEKHEDEHSVDAHIWLGKENIFLIAETVRDELSSILPEQKKYFAENTEKFKADVEASYISFTEKNKGKTPKEFIVFHDAYNYMMQSLKINMNLKVPFSENILHETGTVHMIELIEEIELHGVKHVFKEPQFSQGTLQKFADEYNLILSTLDPLGQDPSASGYLENLNNNLNNLAVIYE